ncbi:MAG: hypothetical protein WKG01_33305 [Kofleriaceae bacterium]
MKSFACSLALVGLTATATGQPALAPVGPNTIGIDGVVVLPLGDYGDAASLAFGPIGRLEIPAGPGFVTGRIGVLFHLVNDALDGTSLLFVPVYAGYRYPLGTGQAYLAGELGITFAHARVDTELGSGSDTESELGATLGAGLRMGQLDLRAGLFLPDLGDAIGLMGSIGYDFASF